MLYQDREQGRMVGQRINLRLCFKETQKLHAYGARQRASSSDGRNSINCRCEVVLTGVKCERNVRQTRR